MLLIGTKIQEYRKKAGFSQEEFAKKIGVTRQAVSKWELDKAYPDLDKLVDICDIFQISITELLYGKIVSASEEAAGEADSGEALEMSMMSAEKARKGGVCLRLFVMLTALGGLFLFCGVLLVTTLFHYPWKQDSGQIRQARVERVYQQYTKADICFYDDVSRRVMQTVWIDTDGIREGDYIESYTDKGQQGIYYEYHVRTMIVLAAVTGGFLVLFLLCAAELRRLVRENKWHIQTDEAKEQA
ncbi:MAG: helix-turn-helix domain-containing protein [Butyrivibrio sp.]|nr:helix-turn-helix domain-containing protein [Acetatifactor muris]MCM1558471.1 helix-turn-helix domain-containing protein [Butyrivibrio sp.]